MIDDLDHIIMGWVVMMHDVEFRAERVREEKRNGVASKLSEMIASAIGIFRL